jgi:hypothetical protein
MLNSAPPTRNMPTSMTACIRYRANPCEIGRLHCNIYMQAHCERVRSEDHRHCPPKGLRTNLESGHGLAPAKERPDIAISRLRFVQEGRA